MPKSVLARFPPPPQTLTACHYHHACNCIRWNPFRVETHFRFDTFSSDWLAVILTVSRIFGDEK